MENSINFPIAGGSITIDQTGPDSALLTEQTTTTSQYALSAITVAGDVISCTGPFGSAVTITVTPTSIHIVAKEAWWTAQDDIIPIGDKDYSALKTFLEEAFHGA